MKKIFSVSVALVVVVVLLSCCTATQSPGVLSKPDVQNQQQQSEEKSNQVTHSTESVKQTDTSKDSQPNTQKSADASRYIGEEKAKSIALQKAGISSDGVIFDRVELDNDDGVWQYEVEFRKGRTEYDADIKAVDGTIISWDVDYDD